MLRGITAVLLPVPETIKIAQTIHPPTGTLYGKLTGIRSILYQYAEGLDKSRDLLCEEIPQAATYPGFHRTVKRLHNASKKALAKFDDFRHELGITYSRWSVLVKQYSQAATILMKLITIGCVSCQMPKVSATVRQKNWLMVR